MEHKFGEAISFDGLDRHTGLTNHIVRGSDALLWIGVAIATILGAGAIAVAFIAAERGTRKQEVVEGLTVTKRFGVGNSGQQFAWAMQGTQVIPAPDAATTLVRTQISYGHTAPRAPNVHITPVSGVNGLPAGTVVSVTSETATSFDVLVTYEDAADSLTTPITINWMAWV